MSDTLKVVIPMAGWGTRMRPHTWSKPKPLISVAGKTSLDHLLDMFATLPDPKNVEFIFIIGRFLGEQIPTYIKKHHPEIRAQYVVQAEMKGQSHALWLARDHLCGPVIVVFSDTLLETSFSFISKEKNDGVAWVKPVSDPRRFGVAEVNSAGQIIHLIEKPEGLENNLALVGCYYFKSGERLLAAIDEQMKRGIELKGEYFLVDAVNILLEQGARLQTKLVDIWLDTGTIDTTLETNRYLLDHRCSNAPIISNHNVKILPPVFIHRTAMISDSIIGPYASIGAECEIVSSRIENSIIEQGGQIRTAFLINTITGEQARVVGRGAESGSMELNIGDLSSVAAIDRQDAPQ